MKKKICAAQLKQGSRLKKIFDELKQEYDYIVIDTPPVIVSDVKTLMKYSDVNICVLRAEKSRSLFVERIDYHINKINSINMAFILNDNKPMNDGYANSYGYYGQSEKKKKLISLLPNRR